MLNRTAVKEYLRRVLPVSLFQCLHYINVSRLFVTKKCLLTPYYIKYIILKLLKNGGGIENDEIIAIIEGGLGSQMRQFIQGQEIQRIAGVQVSYDLTWYEKDGKDGSGKENRFYVLEEIFPNVKVKRASKQKIGIYKKIFNQHKIGIVQNLDTIVIKPPMYLGGYYYSEKYQNYDMENLRKLYTFKLSLDENNRKMLDNILSKKCSVAVQIRLGDYTGTVFDVTTPKYYFNAIDYIDKTIMEYKHFFIFSNDIINAKLLIEREGDGSQNHKFTYVNINDNDHGAYDMYLMLHCHHFIIANSTFGQWAALLSDRSKDKIVIQPDKFFKTDPKVNPFYPGWVIIEC